MNIMGYIAPWPKSCPLHRRRRSWGSTEYGVEPNLRECFVDDRSVVAWMKLANLLPAHFRGAPDGLVELALELRANARTVLTRAKAGRSADAAVVNRVIELGQPTKKLEWDSASRSFKVVRKARQADAASLLEPIADAVVKLLTEAPLDRVRQCEAHDCSLLFQDLTKSHRRRWCSMAGCGNRMKVAAFRSRQKEG
jgi:predicted RNA-binding Zn ribbon-like protein